MRESRSPPPFNEEPQISKDFWGFFVFFLPADSSFFRGSFSFRWTFSRWILFCHADFADDADFFSLIILVPQISRIYTDFLWFFSFFCNFFISQILDLSVWDFTDFGSHEFEMDYADFSNSLYLSLDSLYSIHYQFINQTFFRPLLFYQFRFISLFFYQFLLVSLI